MRPRALPSMRVKVRPWYRPLRHKQPSRQDDDRRAIRQDESDVGVREDPLRQDDADI